MENILSEDFVCQWSPVKHKKKSYLSLIANPLLDQETDALLEYCQEKINHRSGVKVQIKHLYNSMFPTIICNRIQLFDSFSYDGINFNNPKPSTDVYIVKINPNKSLCSIDLQIPQYDMNFILCLHPSRFILPHDSVNILENQLYFSHKLFTKNILATEERYQIYFGCSYDEITTA